MLESYLFADIFSRSTACILIRTILVILENIMFIILFYKMLRLTILEFENGIHLEGNISYSIVSVPHRKHNFKFSTTNRMQLFCYLENGVGLVLLR